MFPFKIYMCSRQHFPSAQQLMTLVTTPIKANKWNSLRMPANGSNLVYRNIAINAIIAKKGLIFC